jgi:hypothetical protein
VLRWRHVFDRQSKTSRRSPVEDPTERRAVVSITTAVTPDVVDANDPGPEWAAEVRRLAELR